MGGLVVLACGAGLFGYRYTTHPTTLSIAVGSLDGVAPQLMSALAARLASTGAPVRLKVVDKGTELEAIKAFSGRTSGLGNRTRRYWRSIHSGHGCCLHARRRSTHRTARRSITSMDDLKGKTIGGVIGGEVNHKVVDALANAFYLSGPLLPLFRRSTVADIPQGLKSQKMNAVLVVMPVTEKYLTMLRNLFPRSAKQKLILISIEFAGAIAAVARYYQSYELPKGTVQGSPPIPDDDMTTLRVPFYLVANKKLPNDVVGSLAKAIMETHRDLINEYPPLAQISAPNTDKTDDDNDTYIPIHPGANAYFSGDEKTFFDKYGDQIFYASLLLGTATSLFAAVWKYMTRREDKERISPPYAPLRID